MCPGRLLISLTLSSALFAAQDPGGAFQIKLPPGWTAELTPASAVVARSPGAASLVAVIPLAAAATTNPAGFLRQQGAATLGTYLPGAAVQAVRQSRGTPHAALAEVAYRSTQGWGRAAALCALQGGAGTIYLIAAPTAQFEQQRAALMAILRSFSFSATGAPRPARQPSTAPGVTFTRFRDPNEAAFTIDVPSGWDVKGGLVRKSSIDVRSYVRLTSPDHAISVLLGDPTLGGFAVPNDMLTWTGFREGAQYSPGYGNVFIVRRYMDGQQFAQAYAPEMLRDAGGTGLRIRDARERPDLGSRLSGIVQQQTSAGEISFSCQRNGRESAGYLLATTLYSGMGQSAMWWVTTLAGWIAPPDRVSLAESVLQRVLKSYQTDLTWAQRQQQTTARTSQIVTQANDEVSRMISDNYWSQQRSKDRVNENFADYIRGRVRLKDPSTGDELEGASGKNYYWRVGLSNRAIGTDGPIPPPNIDVTELEQIR